MDLTKILQDTVSTIGVALVGLLGAYMIYFINKATAKIKEETSKISDERQRKLFQDAVDRVNSLALKTVAATNQTVVTELKLAIAKGTKDKPELLALGGKVAESVYRQLTPEVTTVLQSQILDVQKYVLDIVEMQVGNLKGVCPVVPEPILIPVEIPSVVSQTPTVELGIIPQAENPVVADAPIVVNIEDKTVDKIEDILAK